MRVVTGFSHTVAVVENRFIPMPDGAEVLAWITAQKFCGGQVAMNAQLPEIARNVAPFVGEMIPRITS